MTAETVAVGSWVVTTSGHGIRSHRVTETVNSLARTACGLALRRHKPDPGLPPCDHCRQTFSEYHKVHPVASNRPRRSVA